MVSETRRRKYDNAAAPAEEPQAETAKSVNEPIPAATKPGYGVVTALDKKLDEEIHIEFGGPAGVAAFIVFSHFIVYYMWICNSFYGGAVQYPSSLQDVAPWCQRMWAHIVTHAAPTKFAMSLYFGFLFVESILAVVMPGLEVEGLPIPSEGGRKLKYLCNGLSSWWLTLVAAAYLHWSDIMPLQTLVDHLGPMLTASVFAADLIAILVYLGAFVFGKTHRMSGNHLYDFFMGGALNPRIGSLDLKMWAEIRMSWILLFWITVSCAAKQYQTHGFVSAPMALMVLAHFLYTNACMKGEECIPTTFDFFYEKWGFMLIFWNFSGVPFVYTFSSVYLMNHAPTSFSTGYTVLLFSVLLIAYYVWDTSNSQKNRFRMIKRGTFSPRPWAFPQLPWGTLPANAKCVKTKNGSDLLVDGWFQYARKLNYTGDIVMALIWGLSCGFDNFLPYFYFFFFTSMIIHRCIRDTQRCAVKYGEDWNEYTKRVPYIFVPGLI